jgi:putative serine protease PepD
MMTPIKLSSEEVEEAMIAENFQTPTVDPPADPPASAELAPPRPSRRVSRPLAAGFVLAVLAGSMASGAATAELINRAQPTTAVASTPVVSTSTAGGSSTSLASMYTQVSRGVVTITTQVQGRFGSAGQGTGSGLVVDTAGNIVTNAHVVSGAQNMEVTFSNGQTASATLVGINSSADLAVIHVSVASSSLHPVVFGNSDALLVGDSVYAIGAPFGLTESLSAGIVSGLHRTNSGANGNIPSNLIQVDAAINPGNSGGALLNNQGQVVGINESIESPVNGNVGVGFAIPSNTVQQLLPSLDNGSNT